MGKSTLSREHLDHLLSEGFTETQVKIMQAAGVRSFTAADAQAYNIGAKDFSQGERYINPSGLYFPFSSDWGQIRCDKPPIGKDGKPRKYLNPSGQDSQAWLPDDCKAITEGAKDAWAGTLHGGVSTGALAGVSHYEKALPEGSGYTILFDADGWHNPQVFGNLINAGLWVKGKVALLPEILGNPKAGLCEYFKAGYTADNYKHLLDTAKTPKQLLKEWPKHWKGLDEEKQGECIDKALQLAARLLGKREQAHFTVEIAEISGIGKTILREQIRDETRVLRKKREGARNQAFIANGLAKKYTNVLAYDADQHEWHWYGRTKEGLWDTVSDGIISQLIKRELDSIESLEGEYSASYHQGVVKLVQAELTRESWNSDETLIPFENGVLDLNTRRLKPHSPDWGLRWQLPRPYVVIKDVTTNDFPKISTWLDFVTKGSQPLRHLLFCWLNAVLLSRYDLQKFLYLVGPGGTGKGTFMRLASELIGEENVHSSTLDIFCTDKFEASNITTKKLVLFPDEDKYSGRLGPFKQLTGGDKLRAEKKQKMPFSFTFRGVAMLSANFPIFAGDTTSSIARRVITAPFNQQVPPEQRTENFEVELHEELPALTSYLLQMDNRIVRNTLLGIGAQVPEVTQLNWELRMRTDAVTAWFNECVVRVSDAEYEYVGRNLEDTSTLFGSYQQWCRETGSKPKGSREFTPALLELCQSIIGWKDVKKGRAPDITRKAIIYGIKLRDQLTVKPNPIDALIQAQIGDQEAANDRAPAPDATPVQPSLLPSSGTDETGPTVPIAAPEPVQSDPPAQPAHEAPSIKVGTRVKIPPYRMGHNGTVLKIEGFSALVKADGAAANETVRYDVDDLLQLNGQAFPLTAFLDPMDGLFLTPDHPEWHVFEKGLIQAQTQADLDEVKARTAEAIRIACMEIWRQDGRRTRLKAKSQRLKGASESQASLLVDS